MKSLSKIIGMTALGLISNLALAQQTQLSSLYSQNLILINPAETGFNEVTDFSLSYRKQWSGLTGSPSTAWLSGQTNLKKKMGIGGYVIYDQLSFVSNLEAKLNYAYHLKLAKDFKLSFGLSAGIIQNQVDFGGILADDYSDEVLMTGLTSGIAFNAVFGTVIEFKDLKLGVSLPQILSPSVAVSQASIETNYDLKPHLNVYGTYTYKANEVVEILPTVLFRRSNASSQLDAIANFRFNKNIFLGAGYRQGSGLLFNIGGKFANKVQINYAYDFGGNGIGSQTGGSHEIMLKYVIGKDFPNDAEPVEAPEGEPKKVSNRF